MKFLLLQTFALMALAFFLGAALGCLARRLLSAGARDADTVSAGSSPTLARAQVSPQVPAPVVPVVAARSAPSPTMPAAPVGGIAPAATGAAMPEPKPSTLGIPRSAPDLIQPQIQRIDLTPSAVAVAPTGLSTRSYPITTVGIPSGFVVPPLAAPPGQPRPEPLRPELAARAAAQPTPAAAAPAASPATSPAASAEPEPVPFTPVVPSSAALAALAARAAGDDFLRIRTIDAALQARLKSAGVTRFAEIAKWTPDDVARQSQTLGLTGQIERESWIEQAQILASGGETDYSRRRQRGEGPAPSSDTSESVRAAPNISVMAERASAVAAAAAAAASAAAAARVTPADAALPTRLSDAIRENARASEGESGRAGRPDLAGLRSVRSEALRGNPLAADNFRGGGQPRTMGTFDDLKRVRGIGVLIEKKLNSLGINSYEQLANWTDADIDRISQVLDFKGRVERESWVEQARILASGGQTDFSKRVDRGEA